MANIANLITKLTGIIASLDDIRDAISQGGGGSSTASGVSVTPTSPLTGTNLQATTNETAALLQDHTDEISALNSSIQALVSDDYAISFNSNNITNVTSAIVKIGNYLIVSATFVCTVAPGANNFAVITKTDSSRISLDKNYVTIAHPLATSTSSAAYVNIARSGDIGGTTSAPLVANSWYNLMFMVKLAS